MYTMLPLTKIFVDITVGAEVSREPSNRQQGHSSVRLRLRVGLKQKHAERWSKWKQPLRVGMNAAPMLCVTWDDSSPSSPSQNEAFDQLVNCKQRRERCKQKLAHMFFTIIKTHDTDCSQGSAAYKIRRC